MKADGSDMGYTVGVVKEVKKIDDLTVDLVMDKPNPILRFQITSSYIMSKAWAACECQEEGREFRHQ